MTTPTEAPKIEFPCPNYPVKILGVGAVDYVEVIFSIVREHAPECDPSSIRLKDSNKGSFQSLTVYITAQSVDHLSQLHQSLMAHQYVRMVI